MSHLDEGRLHAYLDGAETARDGEGRRAVESHLSVCADCRQRLDEARRLRDRAGAILRASGPGLVTTPPFEQIAARKRRITPRRAPRTVVLAWAATVALALGLGWYARSLAVDGAAGTADIAQAPAAAPSSPQVVPEAAGPAREPVAPAERPVQLADRLAAGPAPTAPAPVTDTAMVAEQRAVEADTRPNTRDLARLAVQRAAPAAGAEAQPPRAEPMAAAAEEAEAWVPVNRVEAERRLDDQLAALPELETLGITVKEGAGVPQARTVQRLPDGRSIELIQERILVEKREEAPERLRRVATPATATVEWSNSRVTARGPLPADSLRALLRLLRRAQPPEPDQLRDH